MAQVFRDFTKYLRKHDVIALAVGVMIAQSLTGLTNSLVENIIKPMIDPVIDRVAATGNMDKWEFKTGPFHLKLGKFLKHFIEFIIVGIVIVSVSNLAERIF